MGFNDEITSRADHIWAATKIVKSEISIPVLNYEKISKKSAQTHDYDKFIGRRQDKRIRFQNSNLLSNVVFISNEGRIMPEWKVLGVVRNIKCRCPPTKTKRGLSVISQ